MVNKIIYPAKKIDQLIGKHLEKLPLHKESAHVLKKIVKIVNPVLDVPIQSMDQIPQIQEKISKTLSFYNNSDMAEELDEEELRNKKQNAVESTIKNLVVSEFANAVQEEHKGKTCRWLPSNADNPSPEHEQYYFEEFDCDAGINGDFPGQRPNCQCGIEIKE